jgi:hypothetical protein
MEGFEILGISIIFFVVYLYLPAATYRFAAETRVDLRRATDLSELEAFISAAIPSAVLNGVTFLLLLLVAKCPILRGSAAVLHIDWDLLASFITSVHRREAFGAIVSGARGTLLYVFSLLAVSFAVGRMYGESMLVRLADSEYPSLREQVLRPLVFLIPRGRREVFRSRLTIQSFEPIAAKLDAIQGPLRPNGIVTHALMFLRALRLFIIAAADVLDGANWKFGNSFLHESVEWMFRWSLKKPTVFVRAKGDRLFFGKFLRYTKNHEGDIGTISLIHVERYCAAEAAEILRDGRLPFEPFNGTLTLMWEEIADIHEAMPKHFEKLRARYVESKKLILAQSLLDRFDGEELSYEEICSRTLGTDHFTRDDVRVALAHLIECGAVSATPTVEATVERYAFARRRAAMKSTAGATETHPGGRLDDVSTVYPPALDRIAMGRAAGNRRRKRNRLRLNERRRGGGNRAGFIGNPEDVASGGNDDDSTVVRSDPRPPV